MSRADSIAERLSRKEIAFLVEQNPPPHHPPSRSVSAHAVDALVAPRIPTYRGPDSTPPRHSSATRDRSHATVSEEQSGSRQRHSTSHHGRLRPGNGHPHAQEGEEQEGITPTHGSHRHVHRRRVYKGHRDSTDGDQPPSPSPRGYSRRRRSLRQHHASTSPSISAEASVSVVREMTATSSKVMVHPQTPHAYESSATSDSPVVAPTGSPPDEVMEPTYTLPLPSSTPSHSGAVPPCAAPFQEDARSSAVGAKEAPTAAAASAASVGDGAVVAATPSSATTHEASVPRRSPLVVEGSRAMYQTPIGSSTRVERGSPMTFSPSRSSGAFERLQAPSCVVSVFVALSGGATTSLGRLEEEEEEYEVMGVTLDATTMHEILLAVEAQLPLPRQPVIRASTSAVGEVQPRPVGSLRLLASDNAHLRHVLRHGIPPIVVLREEHCLADVVDVRQLCSVCPSSELVRVFLRWVEPIRQRRLIASPSPSPMTTPRHRESSHLAPTPPTRAIMGAVEGEDDGHRHVTKQYADPTHGEMLARQRLDMGEPGDHDAVGHPHERVPTNTHSVEELSEEVMAVDVDGVSSTSGSTACVSVVIETAPLPAGPPPTAPMLLPKIDAKETEEEGCTKHELPSSECGDVACVPEMKREVEEEEEVDHQPSSADRRLSSTQISPSELDHHVASITPHDESSGADSGPPVLVSCQREYMTPVAASAAPVAVGEGALSKLPPSEPFAPGWREATEALTHFLRESMSTAHTTSTVDAVTGRPQHYITIESRVDEMRIKSIQVEVPVHHSYDNSPRSDA